MNNNLSIIHEYDSVPEQNNQSVNTDTEFKVPWFRQVLKPGWDYVGRTRLLSHFHDGDEQWRSVATIYPKATDTPRYFPGALCKSNSLDTSFVLYKQKPQGRHDLNRKGKPRRSKTSKAGASANKDPWLLVTSLSVTHGFARRIVRIYATRMQIEESFRDMKSHRFELALETHNTSIKRRMTILILLTTLAYLVSVMTGLTVYLADKHRRYQANTIRHKKVLSFHFLGLRVFKDPYIRITDADFCIALLCYREAMGEDYMDE